MAFRRELETPRASRRTRCARTAPTCATSAPGPRDRDREPGGARLPRPARLRRGALRARRWRGRAIARKLAAVRSFHDHLVRAGAADQNPAELLPTPKAHTRLPRVLGPDEVAQPARPHPRPHPARGPRPRPVRARLLVRPARGGDRRPGPRRDRLRVGDACACSARARRRGSSRSASPPSARSSATCSGAPRARLGAAGGGAVPLAPRPPPVDLRRPPAPRPLASRGRRRRQHLAAHPPPFLRHPPAGGRRGPPLDPGAARPLEPFDHPDLHSGRAEPAAQRIRTELTLVPKSPPRRAQE